jgi:hypothetical protein
MRVRVDTIEKKIWKTTEYEMSRKILFKLLISVLFYLAEISINKVLWAVKAPQDLTDIYYTWIELVKIY